MAERLDPSFYSLHGGPAYPIVYERVTTREGKSIEVHVGMSLRDWFAGQALTTFNLVYESKERPDLMAERAYAMADAMLNARGAK